jgi:general secretion pathway protein D
MRRLTRSRAVAAVTITLCLLCAPLSVYAKKGEKNYRQGTAYEMQKKWELAAQEFALALAANPSDVEYLLHYQRAVFNASQSSMEKGRAAEEQGDYQGAYNSYRQAYAYDTVNELALAEMERMLRLQQQKINGLKGPDNKKSNGDVTLQKTGYKEPGGAQIPQQVENKRVVTFAAGTDLKQAVKELARALDLNVVFDTQSFRSPRTFEIYLRDVTTAQALDLIFLQEGLFFQKLSRRTILVADQSRRPQFQQLVIRTFYLANAAPEDVQRIIQQAIPAQAGRTQSIVIPDKTTNSLTIRDTAENIRIFEDLIRSIDKDRAEVVMDVNIYEVNRNSLLQIGNQVGSPGSAFSIGGSPGVAGLTNNGSVGTGTGINLNSVVGAIPTGLAFAFMLPPSTLTMFQSSLNSRLIASTQVHAFNGEESSARIGQRVPVQTAQTYPYGYSGDTTTKPGTGGTNPGVFGGGFPVINYEPTGLTLKFTPQVFPNKDVQVKMSIESKDVTGENTLTPTFTERTISGTARIQNNRTMMLASVASGVETNSRGGLPLIGLIPILGRLFTSPTKSNRQVDIVIAVTPRVLRAPAITPEDEAVRETGSVSTPTSSSLADMVKQEDEEDRIAALHAVPQHVAVQLPDRPIEPAGEPDGAQPAYVPATGSAAANVAPSETAPKTADASPVGASITPKPIDSSARTLKIGETADTGAQNALTDTKTPLARLVENSINGGTAAPIAPTAEIRLLPAAYRIGTGEKQRITVTLSTPSPLGTVILAFKLGSKEVTGRVIAPGQMLIAQTGILPTISQSMTLDGTLLVTIIPPAGEVITGSGPLLYLELEGLGPADASVSLLKDNIHLLGSDGRTITLK